LSYTSHDIVYLEQTIARPEEIHKQEGKGVGYENEADQGDWFDLVPSIRPQLLE